MSEWWTYSPHDLLMFAPRTYYRLFELHNTALWPWHLLALAAGVAILALLWRDGPHSGRIIAAVLAGALLWVAWSFLLARYATINWAARYLAILLIVEAALLMVVGTIAGRLRFASRGHHLGLALFVFALAVQPWLGWLFGRPLAQAEVFAVAPDPTAVAVLGLLATTQRVWKWVLLPIPVLWCAISGATLWAMGAPDAWVPPAAAALAALASLWPERRT